MRYDKVMESRMRQCEGSEVIRVRNLGERQSVEMDVIFE